MPGAGPCPPRARHTGHSTTASAGSVTSAMATSWALLTIELCDLATDPLPRHVVHDGACLRRRRLLRPSIPARDHEHHEYQPGEQADVRNHPDEQSEAPRGRRQEYPVAVLVDEVGRDLGGRLAGGQALADDLAHLMRGLGRGVGDREALT